MFTLKIDWWGYVISIGNIAILLWKQKEGMWKLKKFCQNSQKNNPFYIKITVMNCSEWLKDWKKVSPCLSAKLEKLWQGSWVRIVVAPSGLPQLLKYDIGGQNCPKKYPVGAGT